MKERKREKEKERKRHAHVHILWLLSNLRILRQTFGVVLCDVFINNLPLNEVQVLCITG
jgi:hypothetical protein